MGVTHKNVGNELTYTEYHAADSHIGGGGGNALIVAAADTPTVLKERADYVCTGTSATGEDEIIINTALGVAAAVVLCPGTFWVSGSIVLATGKSLIGSGNGTVIKVKNSYNDNVNIISASSVNRILIADLMVDGNKANQAWGAMNGIYFSTVTYSTIARCCVENVCGGEGIYFVTSSNTRVTGNTCQGNANKGITMSSSSNNNTITGNSCMSNGGNGIDLVTSSCNNIITNNNCMSNHYYGIDLTASNNNIVTGNNCQSNDYGGIALYACNNNVITDNNVVGNSQGTDNTDDGICMNVSDYNNVQGNTVRHGGGAKQHRYGICIVAADSDGNLVTNNDLYLSGKTGSLHDAGTGTVTAAGNRL